ncbi:class I SAM-dependent methyltransferase [Methylorubrum salsuginis]|uniref:Methyltransferase domain-containing protein n=1 Tax=Methylorubrum salsuginis TaxID=414703 RepID=A0A1I4N225_9HYPH|nr:class I SAM-dependent methyltransferase [Methylorubrum salsuginis]SFM09250.1 Methyltransferase domain-containing protein [Methylorubrum salsuginis]
MICSVCNAAEFEEKFILWDGLCREWQIAPHERSYIDRQQGTRCTSCGSNLRSIILAQAIIKSFGYAGCLNDWVKTSEPQGMRILELNGAGRLTPVLSQLPGHIVRHYPDVDMHNLPYVDASFDLVVHSDTLEHVSNPVHALAECRRILGAGGVLAFTVPVIVERLTRGRDGLPPSYHGRADTTAPDYRVFTEYGSDMWTHVIKAGFDSVTIHTLDYPAASAMAAIR